MLVKPTTIKWALSSEFVSSSSPSWQILTAHAQTFRGARDLAFCLKVPLDSLLVWASSEGSGETARMRRLAWTFAARICDKYQIRLARPKWTSTSPTTWTIIWAMSWENLFMPYVNNKGTDQPAHPRSLISAFVVSCLDSIILLLAIAEISRLKQRRLAWVSPGRKLPKTGFLVKRLVYGFNPFMPSLLFLGHRQTVQTQIRCHRTLHCLLIGIFTRNIIERKKIYQTPLNLEMDSSKS